MPKTSVLHMPRLRAVLEIGERGDVELHTPQGVFEVEPPDGVSRDKFLDVLQRLDGDTHLHDLQRDTGLDKGLLCEILEPAVFWGLIDDGRKPDAQSGLAVLSRLEEVFDRLLENLVLSGPFWQSILGNPETLPANVFYGFGLENWFFLFHENEFDSAMLAHAENVALRAVLNDFYHEEHRHDDIVIRAFEPLGITKADLLAARPLPTTTSLIKMLSWWARTDPLFFAATIGVLEGRLESDSDNTEEHFAYDSFLTACHKNHLPPAFVEPLRAHARVNASHDHGAVSRELFALVPGVDVETERRWLAKAHLFMETYAGFFNGILSYYSNPKRPLLRRPFTTEIDEVRQ